MRKTKDSGIPWIGEIPEAWELRRLKYVLRERKVNNDPQQTDFILSLGVEYGVIPYSEKKGGGGNKSKETVTDYRLAFPNDIVMNSMNIIAGSVGLSRYFGCVSPVYYVLYPDEGKGNSSYYCYLFKSVAFQRSLLGLGNGILMKESSTGSFNTVRMRIPMEKLGVQLLPVPALEEQSRITAYLDARCAEIDSICDDLREEIATLAEYKRSVITEVVTKGLEPRGKMKDSGIPWIGEIPETWEVKHIKRCVQSCVTGSWGMDPGFDIEDLVCLRVADFNYPKLRFKDTPVVALTIRSYDKTTIQKLLLRKGDILLEKSGGGEKTPVGRTVVFDKDYPAVYSNFLTRIRSTSFITYSWLQYLLSTLYQYGVTRIYIKQTTGIQNLDLSSLFANECIPIPSLDEQIRIAAYLDERCAEIDSICDDLRAEIATLESLKKSTIYEYATGKKEVPSL